MNENERNDVNRAAPSRPTAQRGVGQRPSATRTPGGTRPTANRTIPTGRPVQRPVQGQGNPQNIARPAQRPGTNQQNGAPRTNTASNATRPNAQRNINPAAVPGSDVGHNAYRKPTPKKKKKASAGLVALIAVVVAAILVAAVMLILFVSGVRYKKQPFIDDLYGNYSIRFLGRVDDDNSIISGKFFYDDGSQAKIEKIEDGIYRLDYSNGNVYEGQVSEYQKNGSGKLTLENGDTYVGSFLYDDMWGEGTYSFNNGDCYVGNFVAGKKDGQGVYTWAPNADGASDRYEGAFKNDMRNGSGKFYYADGSVYEGKYVDDKKSDDNGRLIIALSSGLNDIYEGGFVNDVRSGYGTYTWANGDVYRGNFINNLIDTRLVDESGAFKTDLAGNYLFGEQGTIVFTSGRTYKADFVAGEMQNQVLVSE